MRAMIRLHAKLREDVRGLAMLEFALMLPIVLGAILFLLELANYAIVRQRLSQLALQVADNASRIGAQNVRGPRPITEGDINDLMIGAELQAGSMEIAENGRIILSSLERNPDDGQWVRWQRCMGGLVHPSSYGAQGDGATGTAFPGMGRAGARVTATDIAPVMFVEIAYRYRPLIGASFAPSGTIVDFAAMTVRDDRDTSQVHNTAGDTVLNCS